MAERKWARVWRWYGCTDQALQLCDERSTFTWKVWRRQKQRARQKKGCDSGRARERLGERNREKEIERETWGRFLLSFCFTRSRLIFLLFAVANPVKPFAGGYRDSLLETAREAPTILPQGERNKCDSKDNLWAFVLGSRTASICALCHKVLCTYTPIAHSAAIPRFFSLFVRNFPTVAPQFLCQKVIWPSPGTLLCGDTTCTGWSWVIECHIFVVHFPQKSPIISGSFAKNDMHLQAFYGSSQPCNHSDTM